MILKYSAAELEGEIQEVAVVDPMLAGWYSIWTGIAHIAAGEVEAAQDFFEEARRRIGRNLPLPRKRVSDTAVDSGPSVTPIEEAIRQIASLKILSKANDRIARLRIEGRDAFADSSSHKQCEEAVRAIGAGIGFISSRPCTDFGKGPDNLWIDANSKQAIAFELKTYKAEDSALSKDDIGQGHGIILSGSKTSIRATLTL